MKRIMLIVLASALVLSSCFLEPSHRIENCNIRVNNNTKTDILIQLVKTPGTPGETFSRQKYGDHYFREVEEASSYTLYVLVSEGYDTKYESGYSYQIEKLSPLSSVEILTTDIRNTVNITYDGTVHFEQTKENPNK